MLSRTRSAYYNDGDGSARSAFRPSRSRAGPGLAASCSVHRARPVALNSSWGAAEKCLRAVHCAQPMGRAWRAGVRASKSSANPSLQRTIKVLQCTVGHDVSIPSRGTPPPSLCGACRTTEAFGSLWWRSGQTGWYVGAWPVGCTRPGDGKPMEGAGGRSAPAATATPR